MTTTLKGIKGNELPARWRQQAGVTDRDYVSVTITRQPAMRGEKPPVDMARVHALIAKIHALPVLDSRTPDEIIGYDEFGLPR